MSSSLRLERGRFGRSLAGHGLSDLPRHPPEGNGNHSRSSLLPGSEQHPPARDKVISVMQTRTCCADRFDHSAISSIYKEIEPETSGLCHQCRCYYSFTQNCRCLTNNFSFHLLLGSHCNEIDVLFVDTCQTPQRSLWADVLGLTPEDAGICFILCFMVSMRIALLFEALPNRSKVDLGLEMSNLMHSGIQKYQLSESNHSCQSCLRKKNESFHLSIGGDCE